MKLKHVPIDVRFKLISTENGDTDINLETIYVRQSETHFAPIGFEPLAIPMYKIQKFENWNVVPISRNVYIVRIEGTTEYLLAYSLKLAKEKARKRWEGYNVTVRETE
jgi:hypothetical protein